ncbi:ascorbate transporter, chloroplastic isoform X3 [Raphanus sativus]|uniref:Ascorbate transporter, chloroplastic isoform X3 n=1 Tax=Raphanus sativus TaxID=3726 RepID=A0A9W3DE86_RAPSA|nr:ascorbate transporter, chloroplastic isoform X3 [Raphanus sativus]
MAIGGLISNRNCGSFIASSSALCRSSHQQRQRQILCLQHELGHKRRTFGCFLLSGPRSRDKRSPASYKSEEIRLPHGGSSFLGAGSSSSYALLPSFFAIWTVCFLNGSLSQREAHHLHLSIVACISVLLQDLDSLLC